jgi:hypothetical protein
MEFLVFVFVVMFSDAPPIMTAMDTRVLCETMRVSIEPEILKMGNNATVSGCMPVLIRHAPQA